MITSKARSAVLVVLATLLTATLTQKWYLMLFALPLLYALTISSYQTPPEEGLRVSRKISRTRLVEGEEARVSLVLRNTSAATLIIGVSESVHAGLVVKEGSTRGLFVLRPGEEKSLSYRVQSHKRGRYTIGPALVEVYDPFLFRKRELLQLEPDELVFLPSMPRKYRVQLRARYTIPRPGEVPSRQPGEGGDFLEVGEAQGLSSRHVNWKATAKTRRWMVNVFEGERLTSVLLVLDISGMRLLGRDVDRYVDELVRVASSIAYSLLSAGNRLALLVVGNYRDWVKPGTGKKHLLRVLYSLAEVEYTQTRQIVNYSEVFERISVLVSPSGSSVVVVSPFTEPDAHEIVRTAESMGFTVICVAVNPFSMLRGKLPEQLAKVWRQGVIKRLARKGRRVVVVEP